MATHPVESEPDADGQEPAAPNPTHLPIEPEFGPALPPTEPEDPRGKPPVL
ncbi:MAG: stereocilin [Pseudomonadota bacterium]